MNVRPITCKVIEMAEEEVLSWESIARAALCYLSEYSVSDMARSNEFFTCSECSGLLTTPEEVECDLCEDCHASLAATEYDDYERTNW